MVCWWVQSAREGIGEGQWRALEKRGELPGNSLMFDGKGAVLNDTAFNAPLRAAGDKDVR